ncbi:CaiB/BaiF CoA-transferase family protein [uncultured Serinicoccus sp.]|uniref:CaiB/BaiF CoA transferase family protein n=1 Tax=uncultured Serinicoccus sp. TaxID=735514 RepID=UPI00260EF75E|nr:CoA transferase [uncultured Serinicoccus sp.]
MSDITVIDASGMVAGPFAGTLLAEHGARVIKVEDPVKGDPIRHWGAEKDGVGLCYKSANRNKEYMTLDLRKGEGQELFRRLVRNADVAIVNHRPSTLEKWGLDYQSLKSENPALIVLHISAFGLTGPYADRPGFGSLGEAMSGFAYTTGSADGPPTMPSFALADSVTGMAGAFAVMVALMNREDEGQLIDANLVEPLARLMDYNTVQYDATGEVQGRVGNQWKWTAPRDTFQTRDHKWFVISGSHPNAVRNMFRAIERPDLGEIYAADSQARLRDSEEIGKLVRAWAAEREYSEIVSIFDSHLVSYAPVYSTPELMADQHMVANGVFKPVPDQELGNITLQGPIVRMTGTPATVRDAGGALGVDSDRILRDDLGLSQNEIEKLRATGIV